MQQHVTQSVMTSATSVALRATWVNLHFSKSGSEQRLWKKTILSASTDVKMRDRVTSLRPTRASKLKTQTRGGLLVDFGQG